MIQNKLLLSDLAFKKSGKKATKIKILKNDQWGTIVRYYTASGIYFVSQKPNTAPVKNFYTVTKYINKKTQNIKTPTPLTFQRKNNLLLYKGLEGRQLLDYFKKTTAKTTLVKYFDQLLVLVQELHKLPLPGEKILFHDQKNYINNLKESFLRKQKKFDRMLPKQKQILKKILQATLIAEKKYYNKKNTVLCHGDIDADNAIVNNNKVGLIDFSDVRLSHPADDYAGLIVRLEMMANRFPGQYHECKHPKNFYKKLSHTAYQAYLNFCKDYDIQFVEKKYHAKKLWWYMRMYSFFGIITPGNIKKSQFLYKGAKKALHTLNQLHSK